MELGKYYREKYMNYQLKGNVLADMNPLTKLNIVCVISILGLVVPQIWAKAAVVLVCYLLSIIGKKFKSFAKVYTIFAIIDFVYFFITRQLSVEGTHVFFSLFGWEWTWEGLMNALSMTFGLWAFCGGIILYFMFTEIRDLTYALEKKGMSHVTSYVILSSMQTIKDLKKSSQTIMESQRARGIETEGNFIQRLKALLPMLSPLILGALASTEEKTVAMDARAFSVECKHTQMRVLRPTKGVETVIAVLMDILLIVVLVCKVTGRLG